MDAKTTFHHYIVALFGGQFEMILVELRSGIDLFPEKILSVSEKYH